MAEVRLIHCVFKWLVDCKFIELLSTFTRTDYVSFRISIGQTLSLSLVFSYYPNKQQPRERERKRQ